MAPNLERMYECGDLLANIKDKSHAQVRFKVTVRVISSDSPCQNGNARFTTVHFKALSDQV